MRKLNISYNIISLPLIIINLIAYLSYVIPKFPINHQRVKSFLNTTTFNSQKIKSNLGVKMNKTIYDALDLMMDK